MSQLTQGLIEQFKRLNDKDAEQQLAKRLEALTAGQKGECIRTIIQISTENGAAKLLQEALITAIRTSENRSLYDKKLKTWDKTAESVPNARSYCHQCLSSGTKKRLIELASTQQVDTLRLQLEQQAISTSRPVFYIESPDELICSSPWMSKDKNNRGKLHKGPGGPLYEFLQANKALR
jgi:hypothetical protein